MSVLSNYMEVTRSPVFGVLIVVTFVSVLLISMKAMETGEGFENDLTIEDLMTNCGKNEIIDIVNKKCIEKNVSINNNGSIKVKDSKNNLLYKLNTNGTIKIDNVKYNLKDSKKLLQNVVSEIAGKNTEIEVDDSNTDEADHVFDEVDETPVTEEVTPEPDPNPENDEKNEKPADVAITNDGLTVTAEANIDLDDDDDDDEDGISMVAIIILLISLLGFGAIGYYFYSRNLDVEI